LIETGQYEITLLELCPCGSKDELRARERFHIENTVCVNKNIPNRTHKEFRTLYPQNQTEYRKENREKIKERMNTYNQKNRDKINEKERERYNARKSLIITSE
jgi:hypothetical protein